MKHIRSEEAYNDETKHNKIQYIHGRPKESGVFTLITDSEDM